jgi:CRP-like cAMP-binding protein
VSYESLGLGVVSRQGLRDRLLVLRSSDIFEGFDDAALLLLAEHARATSYDAGQSISRDGDPSRGMYVVVVGKVTLVRNGHEASFGPGTAFGVLALLAREPIGLARAAESTRVLEIPAAALEGAIDESFSVLRSMLRVVGAAVLKARGNLPADPLAERKVEEGSFHEEARSLVERLIQLRSGPFGYMNLEALVDLARSMKEVRIASGQVLWAIGEASTHAYHIDYGRVRCTSRDGRHVDVGRGFTLGVLDVWGSEGRVYEARAETELIGYQIDFENFLSLLETHGEVGLDILRGFAKSLLEQHGTGR